MKVNILLKKNLSEHFDHKTYTCISNKIFCQIIFKAKFGHCCCNATFKECSTMSVGLILHLMAPIRLDTPPWLTVRLFSHIVLGREKT